MSKYPMVPGHEIVGIVTEVGAKVTKFSVGSRAGVGCMVGSCRAVRDGRGGGVWRRENQEGRLVSGAVTKG